MNNATNLSIFISLTDVYPSKVVYGFLLHLLVADGRYGSGRDPFHGLVTH